ncbi:MAG TPA: ribosomal RNA small subunit methyltransferase A [Acholeplasma sp.]|jgi:16S rRNA (adenine1518-N6/adenine1519-N6)-dimethyltransferase|nr:ribosomal RNA small subunit methyltransferase A [Acholeplasma sp.]
MIEAKISLGQNFLVDQTIIKKIVNSIPINKDSLVIEIGPGMGAITKPIMALTKNVIAIELDQRLVRYLEEEIPNLRIINEDALKVDIDSLVEKDKYSNVILVSNLPYYITSPLIEKILKLRKIDYAFLMMEKEVALKIRSKEKNVLSLLLDLKGEMEILFDIGPSAFKPRPKVVSSFVKISYLYENKLNDDFYLFLNNIFLNKRKTLINNLSSIYKKDKNELELVFASIGLDLKIRSEKLSIEDIIKLYKELF